MLHSKQTVLTIIFWKHSSSAIKRNHSQLVAQKLCMWEEIESIHARVYTMYGIQQQVTNQRS